MCILHAGICQNQQFSYVIPSFQGIPTNKLALPVKRTAKHLLTSVNDKITLYQDKFKDLKEAFQGYAILQTEIIVTRVLDVVKDVGECFMP